MASSALATAEDDRPKIHEQVIRFVTGQFDLESVQFLSLPSNGISRIEALTNCVNLVTLDLSHNNISKIEGLDTLVLLRRLDISFNLITRLEGISKLEQLEHLKVEGNRIRDVEDLKIIAACPKLRVVSFASRGGGDANQVCAANGYQQLIIQSAPRLQILDGQPVAFSKFASVLQQASAADEAFLPIPEPHPWVRPQAFDSVLLDEAKILSDAAKQFEDALKACKRLAES